MMVTGIIYSVDLKERIISLKRNNRVVFFYITKNIMKNLKKYIYPGNLISFHYEDVLNLRAMHMVHRVLYIDEISVPHRYGKDILYSKKSTTVGLAQFLNGLENLLFLDIEMSMPPYNHGPSFTSEIIQAGFLLVDKNENVIMKNNYYIKPKKHKFISDRTKDFLSIDYDFILENGISYFKFYNKFKDIINKYQPAVVVFGKNDKLFLERSYVTNELPSLGFITRFVNLNQLLKNYFELQEDPGLFNMYRKLCNATIDNQRHDALEDAIITYKVFKSFKDILCNEEKRESVI